MQIIKKIYKLKIKLHLNFFQLATAQTDETVTNFLDESFLLASLAADVPEEEMVRKLFS